MTSELEAFRAVDFNWTRQLKSIWQDPRTHVSQINDAVADDIAGYFRAMTAADGASKPLGRIVMAPAGYGKTHLVGELRRRAWSMDGWFVLLDFIGIKDFWSSVALGFLNSLQVRRPERHTQYDRLVLKIAAALRLQPKLAALAERFRGREAVRELVRLFVDSLAAEHRDAMLQHRDVVTALILLISNDLDSASVAHAWLQGMELDPGEVRPLGIRAVKREPIDIVRGLSWLMSLTGPTLIAIDQIDAIVSESNVRLRDGGAVTEESRREAQSIIEALALGIMDLHEVTRRAVTVVACLEATWTLLERRASVAVTARYAVPTELRVLRAADAARMLVAARVNDAYAAQGFVPPFETWPFAPEAFDTAIGFSPRQLLRACEEHRLACLAAGAVTVRTAFGPAPALVPAAARGSDVDDAFAAALQAAQVGSLLEPDSEDALCALLRATLSCFVQHLDLPDDVDATVQGDPDQRRPSLHGRLAFIFRGEDDREQHYCFRILHHTNPMAFQSRLKAAMTASGVDRALRFRHLFVLRQDEPPGGEKSADLVKQFRDAGGVFVALTPEDVRVFVALQAIAGRDLPGFDTWLRARRPLFETPFFKTVGLCPPPFLARTDDGALRPTEREQPVGPATGCAAPVPPAQPVAAPPDVPRAIPVGHRHERGVEGAPEHVPVELLRRHTAILAGSGSGKTVLVRRIVEEAALLGIPAVVLDSNNDLATLGEAWPQRPPQWTDADAAKAAAYHRTADAVVWTPGRASGNPLSLALLPDFAALSDADERAQAVEMARATLEPLVSLTGKSGALARGVLADALRGFAAGRAGGLAALVDFLSELPDDVSQINDAPRLAGRLADELRAAIATNPLLHGRDPPVDCRALFTSEAAGRTRISVINLGGLAAQDVRDAFVNQLNMALFGWIRRNPSEAGLLYVIDEAQNFAPSQQATACKQSMLSLAAQARKYGLGMIFATQTPKGIDNKIVSNCTTHFYGKMNAPATIAATRELLEAKGGSGADIAKLAAGEFYFATEGLSRPVRIRAPLCLSHHPKTPLPL